MNTEPQQQVVCFLRSFWDTFSGVSQSQLLHLGTVPPAFSPELNAGFSLVPKNVAPQSIFACPLLFLTAMTQLGMISNGELPEIALFMELLVLKFVTSHFIPSYCISAHPRGHLCDIQLLPTFHKCFSALFHQQTFLALHFHLGGQNHYCEP